MFVQNTGYIFIDFNDNNTAEDLSDTSEDITIYLNFCVNGKGNVN